jgi:hypothetical protein
MPHVVSALGYRKIVRNFLPIDLGVLSLPVHCKHDVSWTSTDRDVLGPLSSESYRKGISMQKR